MPSVNACLWIAMRRNVMQFALFGSDNPRRVAPSSMTARVGAAGAPAASLLAAVLLRPDAQAAVRPWHTERAGLSGCDPAAWRGAVRLATSRAVVQAGCANASLLP